MNSTRKPPAPETSPDAFKPRGRIVLTLLAVLVLVGLAPMATVAWKLIDINHMGLTTAQQEYQLLLASAITHEVEVHVEGLRSQLHRVAQTLGGTLSRGRNISQQEIPRLLEDVVDTRMSYLRFARFRGDRVTSFSAGTLPGSLESLFTAGLENAAEALGSQDRNSDPTILSQPILLEARPYHAVIVISAPVVSGGRVRGVLSALVNLQTVWESVVIKQRTGHVIFASDDMGHVFASTNPVVARPGQEVSRSELVSRFLGAEGRARETMPFVQLERGAEQRFMGSYEVTQHGWGIFVQARESDVYWPVQRMIESTLMWALAALGLAVLSAFFFAKTLSQPIKRLAAASRAFASGGYSTRVAVRSRNEVGELAHTFNTMAEAIEDQIRRLRQAAEENTELFLGTIRALAQAIDAKDPYTRGHSVRVNRYSVILARQLALSDEEIRDIHVASLLHDVGKIGIHDSILNKPGKLTAAEYEIMKTHPAKGADIMAPIRRMKPIIPGLRWHHERWEGTGYPDGLERDGIPLMARIIAVADTFDAMTTHRPYQKAMTFDDAHKLLNDLKGLAFDEKVIEGFNRAYHQGLIRPEPEEAEAPVESLFAIPA